MQCAVCYRKTENEYCNLHEEAYKNTIQAYQKWNAAKPITWSDYLKKIIANQNSGLWVIEVCRHLLTRETTSQI
jgi:hypothetical protein